MKEILSFLVMIVMAAISAPESVLSQVDSEPTATVINSKYLTISENRYRSGDFSDQITGNVVNNSTQEISVPSVYAALYDENDQLITVESGYADVSPLPPADNSAFSISLYLPEEDTVDHYTLFAAGRPS